MVSLVLAFSSASAGPLLDQNGREVPPSALGGHWLMVYFGYASCPDVCPVALTTMTRALSLAGSTATNVRPVFVSLDPENDTPERLRAYVAHFSPRVQALTGSPDAIAEAAATFGVPWKRGSDGRIDHGVFIYLVGPDGTVVESFHSSARASDIASRLRRRVQVRNDR